MALKRTCDACGETLPTNHNNNEYHIVTVKLAGALAEEFDLCRVCIRELVSRIRSNELK